MQEDFVDLLLASASLAAQCGTRIYWSKRPQGSALPAIILHRVGGRKTYTYTGPDKLKMTRVQADIYAKDSYSDAVLIARAFENLTDGFKGIQGSTEFAGIFMDERPDQLDAGTTDAEQLFRVSFDLLIHHKEI